MTHASARARPALTCVAVAGLLLLLGMPPRARADGPVLKLSARELFDRGVGRDVQLSADGSAVELAWGELFEDDGPAAGYSYEPNEETLSEAVWARKDLPIADPAARSARLLVAPGGARLRAVVNGQSQALGTPGTAGKYWQVYPIDPAALVPGLNEIVLHGEGKLWVARAEAFAAGSPARPEPPNRSLRSGDAGRTWDDARLVTGADVDGEYYVRLLLERYRPSGTLVLPVIDAGNLAGEVVGPPVTSVEPIRVELDVEGELGGEDGVGGGASVTVRARSGAAFVPNPATWSEFADIPGGTIARPVGRYLQLELRLATADLRRTPRIGGLTLRAAPRRPADWTQRLRVARADNPPVVRSAVPFEYEPIDHPKLALLRHRYGLDRVVAGAAGEFEVITRLAAWASKQFSGGHLAEAYPAWDATEILAPHADGTPVGGFCQQYNLVFLQACESFGLPGRVVSIGRGDSALGAGEKLRSGHEVVEIWSNDYGKWVYVDGNAAWYFKDAESGIPLSLLELRERQIDTLAGRPARAVELVELAESPYQWAGLDGWPGFLELRLVPRSNFLERAAPVPLNQGMRGWFWSGYHVWSDPAAPASVLYANRLTRRGDWAWTLNHAHCVLEALDAPGELRVHVDMATPGLDAVLASTDGGEARPVESTFPWRLHRGSNELVVRTRNKAGRLGHPSTIVLELDG